MELLEQLAYEKLAYPKGLCEFIELNTDYRTNKTVKVARYVQTLEVWNGKLIERTFAFRKSTSGCMLVNEVERRLQGFRKILIKDILCSMYGKQVNFDEKYKDNHFYICDSNYTYYNVYYMYDEHQIIEELNIPYSQYFSESNQSRLSFYDYISRYLEEPRIELLVKNGLSQFVHCYKKLNLKEKSIDKVFRINQYWVRYLKELSYSDIMIIKNKNHHVKNMEDLQGYKKAVRGIANFRKIIKYLQPKNFEYVEDMNYGTQSIYDDYLNFCEQLRYDLNDKSVLCPKDLKKEHDKLMNLITVKKNEMTNHKFFEAYKGLLPYVYSHKNYVIIPCEKVEELEEESKMLHHCVKSYAERYADRKTNIMFVREVHNVSEPLVTLEFNGKKVIQARAEHNKKPCEPVIDFIRQWAKEYELVYDA